MGNRYDVIRAAAKYDGSPTAHKDVVSTLNKHGHNAKMSDKWCTMTIMAILYDAGCIDLVGGYSRISGDLKKKAVKLGIWHSGGSGILPGDIVVYGDKSNTPNHTELAIGATHNVCGNYAEISKDTCKRRKRSGRNIVGYVRPKYSACPKLDNLGTTILAVETMLGTYGTKTTRKTNLDAFSNTAEVQAEVDRVWNDTEKTIFDIAVYTIANMAGRDKFRRERLGSWYDSVQIKINNIAQMKGKTLKAAAQDVLDGYYGTKAVRELLLGFCGYDAKKVQAEVNSLLEAPAAGKSGQLISLFRDKPRNTKDVDGLQGNCMVFKQEKAAIVVDTMPGGASDKILAELKDCSTIDIYLSHIHSDHTGNANALLKTKRIRRLYVQKRDTVHKDYQSRYDSIVKTAKSNGTEVVILVQGSEFSCGGISGKVIFQQTSVSTDSVNMKSLCTLFDLAGKSVLYCGDHHTGTKESSLKYAKHVDVFISSHHGLYTGDKESFIKGITPDWIIRPGWKAWPLWTVGQDAKTRGADKVYQKYGNLLPGDICGRTVLSILDDGSTMASAERNMTGRTISYTKGGKTYSRTVHTCDMCTFHRTGSMLPSGAKFI